VTYVASIEGGSREVGLGNGEAVSELALDAAVPEVVEIIERLMVSGDAAGG
jgi:hypothetical protein